ncbi:MAG: hypothetical protein Q8R57_01285 [Bacteroidota bacterium]|nr:hypothetical protein [Bacteroidota bacterium]
MDFVFVIIGLSTVWLFMFKIEWLFHFKSFLINIIYNIFLSGASFFLIFYRMGNTAMVLSLWIPLLSSLVFYLLYFGFKRIYKRDPENTFWVFSGKPIQDIVFTFLFWFLGVGVPFILIKVCVNLYSV